MPKYDINTSHLINIEIPILRAKLDYFSIILKINEMLNEKPINKDKVTTELDKIDQINIILGSIDNILARGTRAKYTHTKTLLKTLIDSGACDEGENRMPKDDKLFQLAGILKDEFDNISLLARLNTADAMAAIQVFEGGSKRIKKYSKKKKKSKKKKGKSKRKRSKTRRRR
jgi:hypothetical protein